LRQFTGANGLCHEATKKARDTGAAHAGVTTIGFDGASRRAPKPIDPANGLLRVFGAPNACRPIPGNIRE
jgi:hypothetical protein